MKPIWAVVDQARWTLMLTRVIMISPATTALVDPTTTRSPWAACASTRIGDRRIIRKPPMLTTPACSSAETGVGASMTWISQPWKGSWAHFRIVAMASSRDPTSREMGSGPAWAAAAGRISSSRKLPKCRQIRKNPPSRQMSPTRLIRNFLWAASIAAGRSG